MKPLVVELFCGRFGWSRGFVAEGYRSVGFDIVHESYHKPIPAGCSLALQDVLTLHGSQFRDAACIVASPPCQEFSYMAMPWSRAKAKAAAIRADETGEAMRNLTALFDACFRIQREASEAAGRYIPMVVENVKGAQPWVGPAKAHFGSFYLWGDVESVGGRITIGKFGQSLRPVGKSQKFNPDGTAHGQGSWFAIADSKNRGARKSAGSGHGQNPVNGVKVAGLDWNKYGEPGYKPQGFNVTAAQRCREDQQDGSGCRQGGDWFGKGENMSISRRTSSRSESRKAASALIAEIPYDLSLWVARCFHPGNVARKDTQLEERAG